MSLGACAPAPVAMPATQASEVLAQFAAGVSARVDVCTAEGRSVLRGAVRSYGAEMSANGVAWPAMPGLGDAAPDVLNAVDANVLVALAAGFVEASDLYGPARRWAGRLAFMQWPEIRDLSGATRVACHEVVELQQAAARVMIETERLRQMGERAGGERMRRQHERVERAQVAMEQVAAQVQARVEAARAA